VEHANAGVACIAIGEEPAEVALDGTLRLGSDGRQAVLRLASPRCVTGMKRASVLTEVVVVSDGFDLRSVLDRRVRIRGEVIGDASDLDAPAVVVIAHTVEDLPRRAEP
jgi:hypothetical protein